MKRDNTTASQPPEPLIMIQIRLSDEERSSGVPEPATIEKALESLHLHGSPASFFAEPRHRRSEQCSTSVSEKKTNVRLMFRISISSMSACLLILWTCSTKNKFTRFRHWVSPRKLNKANRIVGCGNYIQFPPLYPEFLFEDVFANPIAGAILANILGPQPELRYLATNSVPSLTILPLT